MFCPKCGAQVTSGSKFSGECGASLNNQENMLSSNSNEKTYKTAYSENNNKTKKDVHTLKSKKTKKYITILILSVLALSCLIVALKLLVFGSDVNSYVILSDGNFELLTDLKDAKTITIDSSRTNNVNPELVSFSPDGKYIYYLSKYDEDTYSGLLCRAEIKKIKQNKESFIEVIDQNVNPSYKFLKQGTLVYKNKNNELYYFNGKTTEKLADNVVNFKTDGNSKVIYLSKQSNIDNLYGIDIKDTQKIITLISCDHTIVDNENFDNIIYYDKKESKLCKVGFNQDYEIIASNVEVLGKESDAIYYKVETESKLLTDFIVNNNNNINQIPEEPNRADFYVKEATYTMLTGTDLKESDYPDLYTSIGKKNAWFEKSRFIYYSMYEVSKANWGSNSEAIHEQIDNFIDRFAELENADGFIPVTEEVKEALKEINKLSSLEGDWRWLKLCYSKEEKTTSKFDQKAYDAALDNYNKVLSNRENLYRLKNELEDPENAISVYNLLKYSNGKSTLISEGVINTSLYPGLIIYDTVDMLLESINLDEISEIDDINQMIDADMKEENYLYSFEKSLPIKISAEAAKKINSIGGTDNNIDFYAINSSILMSVSDSELYNAQIDKNYILDFELMVEDATVIGLDQDTFYYYSGVYSYDDNKYYDLYALKDLKPTLLAKDVPFNCNLLVYDDGKIFESSLSRDSKKLFNTNINLKELNIDGSHTKIANDVTQYARTDEDTIIYISDGVLFSFSKGENNFITNNVDWFWCSDFLKPSNNLIFYLIH